VEHCGSIANQPLRQEKAAQISGVREVFDKLEFGANTIICNEHMLTTGTYLYLIPACVNLIIISRALLYLSICSSFVSIRVIFVNIFLKCFSL
jgi:hypothetical protein